MVAKREIRSCVNSKRIYCKEGDELTIKMDMDGVLIIKNQTTNELFPTTRKKLDEGIQQYSNDVEPGSMEQATPEGARVQYRDPDKGNAADSEAAQPAHKGGLDTGKQMRLF